MHRKLMRALSQAASINPEEVLVETVTNLTAGINTSISRELIQSNEFFGLQDFEIRDGSLKRRKGFITLDANIPDTDKILGIFSVKRFDGSYTLLRFTSNAISKLSGTTWVALTGAALTGGDQDYWKVVSTEDRIFASNGVDPIQELDLSLNTYATLGNAGAFKYVTIANNRLCAAHKTSATSSPIQLATSGNRAYSQWDPSIDISAFINEMVDTEDHTSDPITGLVGLKNNIIIIRENSIWLGEPQPIASVPFNLRKVISGIGCTCPNSIQKCGDDTFIFYDTVTKEVYKFTLNINGVDLQKIGRKINNDLNSVLTDIRNVISTYNKTYNEYELVFIRPGIPTLVYKYCLDYEAWHLHIISEVSYLSYITIPEYSGSIEALGSVPIEDLIGTIAGLSNIISKGTTRIVGTYDGEIYTESGFLDINGSQVSPLFATKAFISFGRKQHMNKLELHFEPYYSSSVNIRVLVFPKAYTAITLPEKTLGILGPNNKVFKFNVQGEQFSLTVRFCTNINDSDFKLLAYTTRRILGGEY